MKSTKTVLRAALALLLALCCLCGSAVTSFAQTPSAAKRSGIVQLGTLLPSDGDETPEVPETPTTPGDSGSTTRTEITVIYFTYPSQVGVGETGSIHITPAPFLTKSADGFWRGVYDGFDVGVTGVSAASMDEGVLRVSPAVATDDGWDNVPRLLLLCACLPACRFVGWNAPRSADDGDASDAVISKLLAFVLPQPDNGFVRQLFLQRSCIFNCHFESSYDC